MKAKEQALNYRIPESQTKNMGRGVDEEREEGSIDFQKHRRLKYVVLDPRLDAIAKISNRQGSQQVVWRAFGPWSHRALSDVDASGLGAKAVPRPHSDGDLALIYEARSCAISSSAMSVR